MRLTVATTTRDRREAVLRAIDSILPQLADGDELLVVDNGSRDGTPEALARVFGDRGSRARLLVEPQGGTSRARNLALAEAANEVVCFLDDDATVCEGWLPALRGAWERAGAGVAAIGGPILPVWDPARPPWLVDHLLYVVTALDLGPEPRPLTEPTIWGANMALRASAVAEVGGFDLELGPRPGAAFGRGEEVELERRLLAAGYELRWEPDVRVEHHLTPERLRPRYFHEFKRAEGARDAASGRVRAGQASYRLARIVAREALAHVRRDTSDATAAAIMRTYWSAALRACLWRRATADASRRV